MFAIVLKTDVERVFGMLNNRFETINFTCEPENGDTLAFLDVELNRKSDGKIAVGVYYKPTTTMRTITSDSLFNIKWQHIIQWFTDYADCHFRLHSSKKNTNI